MNETTVTQNGKILTIERVINAPKDKVWEAYTTPEIFEKWWGPEGWTTRVPHLDLTQGGYLLYCMKCEDPNQTDWYGQESWGKGVYESVTPKDGFVYTDYFCDQNGTPTEGMPVAKIAISFVEHDGKTTITSKGEYESEAALKQVLEMGMEEGIKQTVERLARYLEQQVVGSQVSLLQYVYASMQ